MKVRDLVEVVFTLEEFQDFVRELELTISAGDKMMHVIYENVEDEKLHAAADSWLPAQAYLSKLQTKLERK